MQKKNAKNSLISKTEYILVSVKDQTHNSTQKHNHICSQNLEEGAWCVYFYIGPIGYLLASLFCLRIEIKECFGWQRKMNVLGFLRAIDEKDDSFKSTADPIIRLAA